MNKPVIFSASANPTLAAGIATRLGVSVGNIYHHKFPSGEVYCQLKENVRGADVFLVQSIISPANDNLMELLIMADACRRASAGRITAIIPYLGYSRQDRKDKSRVPISAKLVMDIIAAAGIDRIVTMDLHAPQIAGFTNLPFDHLYFRPALIESLSYTQIHTIVAPDIGAVKRADDYSRKMGNELAFISKHRKNDTTVEAVQFVGDVKDKNVLILDDIVESAGTLIEAAKVCRNNGAKNVYCAVTHNCLTELGVTRLKGELAFGTINGFFYSNTTDKVPLNNQTHVVDVSDLFAKAIDGIINNNSITTLFD